jgi:hypothetical protein
MTGIGTGASWAMTSRGSTASPLNTAVAPVTLHFLPLVRLRTLVEMDHSAELGEAMPVSGFFGR